MNCGFSINIHIESRRDTVDHVPGGSADEVKKVEKIVAMDGVDCVQMGLLDLSASMGYLWDPGHKVRGMMTVAERGVLGGGRACLAGFAKPHDGPQEL